MSDKILNVDLESIDYKILDKKMDCPICEASFTTPRVRMSKVRLYSTDTDLRPYYEGIDVVAYEVAVCPECGYSSLFKTFYDVTENTKDKIKEQLEKTYVKKEYSKIIDTKAGIERFISSLQLLEAKKATIVEYAYIYLKMSWLFRVHTEEPKCKEHERFCQNKFVEAAEQTFAEVRFPALDFEESVFLYLIAELCRRIGDYERAYKYVGKVLVDRSIDPKLRERAMDIKDMIRTERPDKR